jgi:CelD/BcsL family acetyltransferase involved in cellulose biosynthesis
MTDANPFLEPPFLRPALRHLAPPQGVRLVGGLPVQRARRWGRLPVDALVSWRHDYCFLGTPPGDGLDALLDPDEWRRPMLVAQWLAEDSPVTTAMRRLGEQRGIRVLELARWHRAALHRRPEATYLEETLRGTHRKELRRLRRVLGRELGADPVTIDRSDDPRAVDDFLALESSGWKGRAGTALSARGSHERFFRELCEAQRAAGTLQVLSLQAGRRAVAMKVNLLAGDTAYCFKIAHDETLARRSPGVLLEVDMVERFHASRLQRADSCADADNAMINRLWPDRRTIVTLAFVAHGSRGQAAERGLRAMQMLRRLRARP